MAKQRVEGFAGGHQDCWRSGSKGTQHQTTQGLSGSNCMEDIQKCINVALREHELVGMMVMGWRLD